MEKHRDLMFEAEAYLRAHPETGFREVESSKYLAQKFEQLGYTLTYAGDIPGFYTVIDTGRPGPEVQHIRYDGSTAMVTLKGE